MSNIYDRIMTTGEAMREKQREFFRCQNRDERHELLVECRRLEREFDALLLHAKQVARQFTLELRD